MTPTPVSTPRTKFPGTSCPTRPPAHPPTRLNNLQSNRTHLLPLNPPTHPSTLIQVRHAHGQVLPVRFSYDLAGPCLHPRLCFRPRRFPHRPPRYVLPTNPPNLPVNSFLYYSVVRPTHPPTHLSSCRFITLLPVRLSKRVAHLLIYLPSSPTHPPTHPPTRTGTSKISAILNATAIDLVAGGKEEIFTPSYFFLARKPLQEDKGKK